jgi:hypothetical protein
MDANAEFAEALHTRPLMPEQQAHNQIRTDDVGKIFTHFEKEVLALFHEHHLAFDQCERLATFRSNFDPTLSHKQKFIERPNEVSSAFCPEYTKHHLPILVSTVNGLGTFEGRPFD